MPPIATFIIASIVIKTTAAILETLSWLNREMGTQTGYASSLSESENKEGAL